MADQGAQTSMLFRAAPMPSTAAPARARRAGWFTYRRRLQLIGALFVLPVLLFFALFKFGPMFWAIELSFTSYDMVSTPRFIGLENYEKLSQDPVFQASLVSTLIYIAGSTALITVLALALALAINIAVPGARFCMRRCS